MKNETSKKTNYKKNKKSQEGMAIIESIPVLFMVVLLFNFSLGFFGSVHSGILNSIASYNYSLETFRFRSNLVYFRPGADTTNYNKSQNRVHGTVQESDSDADSNPTSDKKWPATARGITFNYKADDATRNLSSVQDGKNAKLGISESSRVFSSPGKAGDIWSVTSKSTPQAGQPVQTARVWIKTVYGICLNADCIKK